MADDLAATVEQLRADLRRLQELRAADQDEIAGLRQREAALVGELAEARDQQQSTGDILRVIAASPTDLNRVLSSVTEAAMRQSHSTGNILELCEEGRQRIVAIAGAIPLGPTRHIGAIHQTDRSQPGGRAILDRRTIHIPDRSSPDALIEFPDMERAADPIATLAVPLVRENEVIGLLHVTRVGRKATRRVRLPWWRRSPTRP